MHQSAWISICSAGLPARCSACLLARLLVWQRIWQCIWQSGCLSVSLEVCSVARRFIWLHLAAGRVAYQSVWHSVCSSACSAGCSSCCSFWCPFCSSVNLVICRSVLLPAGCNFVHLPVPQARCQSVFSSANLAGRAPIWRIFCSISCNWQHICLPAGSPSAGRGPIRSSISLGHCHFRRLNRFQYIYIIANLLSRPRANSGQSTHTFIPRRQPQASGCFIPTHACFLGSADSTHLLHYLAIPRQFIGSRLAFCIDLNLLNS